MTDDRDFEGHHLAGARILVTGATGQVAFPIALALAARNDVVAVARFTDASKRERLEAAGVTCVVADLARGTLESVPNDVDFVCNFAVVKSNRWDVDLAGNAEAVGLLMAHCRTARAFLHCSSTGVYEAADGTPQSESSPLGDNHRVMMPTYSICKIAAEAVARTTCRLFDLPATIARLNVPYGDTGGWPAFHLAMILAGKAIPVRPDGPSRYNPIHEDDIIAMVGGMLRAASVPATTVNWGGDEETSIEKWCEYLGELVGRDVTFEHTTATIGGIPTDNTRRLELVGPTSVGWKEGMRRMVEALHPGATEAPGQS
jgi:UDP-glucuronate 4-epimerase